MQEVPTPNQVRDQINKLVRYLIEVGLADDQNFAIQRTVRGGLVETTFPKAEEISIALRNRSYGEIYEHLNKKRAYNVKLPDGAMLQMMYVFSSATLRRHRLAFFPSPYLEEFQNNPDIYHNEEIYADVVARNIVSFPIRIEYDARDGSHQELIHPKSHMTLGQYENCRIPVTAPITPIRFVDFILRNFYHTAFNLYADKLPKFCGAFPESIACSERGVVHVVVPA